MEDAINTFLQEPEGTKYLAPLPDSSHKPSPSVVQVGVDPQIALGFWVRYNRIKKGMTQDEAAKKLGMKSLFSYQRLERKCNATVAMVSKLMALFPRLNLEAVFN